MTANHTPGRWEAVERVDGRWEVRGAFGDCAEGIPLRGEADVRLQATAPRLADALEALLKSNREMNAPLSTANPLTRSDRDGMDRREGQAIAQASDALSAAGRLP